MSDEWKKYQDNQFNLFDVVEGFSAALTGEKNTIENFSRRASTYSRLGHLFETRVKNKLKNREWVAYGYSLPRKPDDGLIMIPYDVWEVFPKIDFSKRNVKGQGLEFVNVVVNTAQNKMVPPREKQGRPSVRPLIEEAYEALRAAGEIDFPAPKSALFNPIIKWLANRYPDRSAEF